MPHDERTVSEALTMQVADPSRTPIYNYQKMEGGFGSVGGDSGAQSTEDLRKSDDAEKER